MKKDYIDGKMIIPTSKEAYEEYQEIYREKVVEVIEKENRAGNTNTTVSKLPVWLEDELQKAGYRTEMYSYNDGVRGAKVGHKLNWGKEE